MPSEIQNSTSAPPGVSTPLRVEPLSPNGKSRLIGLGIVAALLCIAFGRPIANWVQFALDKERQSYLLLVPVICGYLIWISRHELRLNFKTSIIPGAIFSAAGIAAFLFARFNSNWPASVDLLAAQMLSLVLLTLAATFLFVGAHIMRQVTFALTFLIFCVPVPTFLGDWIEIFLQHTSAEAAYWLL